LKGQTITPIRVLYLNTRQAFALKVQSSAPIAEIFVPAGIEVATVPAVDGIFVIIFCH